MTRVLSVASECVPLIKTGGLADVVGALPAAMAAVGVEMRVMIPGYRAVLETLDRAKPVMTWDDLFGGPARLRVGTLGDEVLYVLDAPHLFDRDGGPYNDPDGRDWPDNPQRFAALSKAAARAAAEGLGGWRPDVLHCHDWQTGFAPLYLRQMGMGARVASVITIHNIAFLGMAPTDMVETLDLPPEGFTQEGFEFWGHISALKAGLVHADKITTVSPRYAEEIMTPEFGNGLDGLLRNRQGDLLGILNGIDAELWAPPYETPAGKAPHRAALRAEFGLPDWSGPLCIMVSRLSEQKGLDLLREALPALLDNGGQLVLLGSGDPGLEQAFRDLAAAHEGVAVTIGYDEALARRMFAGGDAVLVPSRFEPCGLTQLYGLRHGTIPLVAMTGGLADTVVDASPAGLAARAATGVQFHPVTAQALAHAFTRLIRLYHDRPTWELMMKNAMAAPFDWTRSAATYAALYAEMTRPA